MPGSPQMALATMLHSLTDRPCSAWLAGTDSTQSNVTEGGDICAEEPTAQPLHACSGRTARLRTRTRPVSCSPAPGKTSGRTDEESMAMLEDVAATRSGGDG
jgi:hypothetical protein